MELILKLPEGKPPYIGILFNDEVDAGATNSDLVLQHKSKKYKIVLEITERKMNLRLVCQEIVTVRFYNDLKFNSDTLNSWFYVINHSKAPAVNFGHLIMRDGKHKVAKTHPNFQNFVLRVEKIELINSKAALHT